MSKDWFTAKELAELKLPEMPATERGVNKKALREDWVSRPRKGRGGGKEYHIKSLPKKAKEALIPCYVQNLQNMRKTDVIIGENKKTEYKDLAIIKEEKRPSISVSMMRAKQRNIMDARIVFLDYLEKLSEETGIVRDRIIDNIIVSLKNNTIDEKLKQLIKEANARTRDNKVSISRKTIFNWLKARSQSFEALAPVINENIKIPVWADAFMDIYQQPQCHSVSKCCHLLLKETGQKVSIDAAINFLNKLSPLERNKGRMSSNALKKYRMKIIRDTSSLYPTCVYTADGHTFDAEVAHPKHGHPFKPEITSVVDVYTRKVVGFSVDVSESFLSVLAALSNAMTNGGVPLIWYVDLGRGFVNDKMLNSVTGFLTRYGIEMQNSIARNSQARGIIERLHRTVWVEEAKNLPTYIGKDMDAEASQKIHKITRKDIKENGKSKFLMPWDEFIVRCHEVVAEYNNRPHSALPKINDIETGKYRHMTPNEMWDNYCRQNNWAPEKLTSSEVEDLMRPYEIRKTNRGEVQIHNHVYANMSLEAYHGKDVAICYDVANPLEVWVREIDGDRRGGEVGRLICKAILDFNKRDYFPKSYIEQAEEKREINQLKRLDNKAKVIKSGMKNDIIEVYSDNVIPFLSKEDEAKIKKQLEQLAPKKEIKEEINFSGERPTFKDDVFYSKWCLENKERITEMDKENILSMLKKSSMRDLLIMEKIDIEELKQIAIV